MTEGRSLTWKEHKEVMNNLSPEQMEEFKRKGWWTEDEVEGKETPLSGRG